MPNGMIISAIPPLEAGQACDNQKNIINTWNLHERLAHPNEDEFC
jgi:hypothetical protein